MEEKKLNGYDLSRQWFDYAFENPDKVTPSHCALWFWLIELNNRLGWKEKFGVPTVHTMEVLGMRSYNTYKKVLQDLIKWGFVTLIEKSKNQYTTNIVALSNFNKAQYKALDKALTKHSTKHNDIDKQGNKEIIKQEPAKPSPPEKDLIDNVISKFLEVFTDYTIVTTGKERSAAGKLVKIWKTDIDPKFTTERLINSLASFFQECRNIDDEWHRKKMSLSHMVGYYNEIKNILHNPKKKKLNPFAAGSDQHLTKDFGKL